MNETFEPAVVEDPIQPVENESIEDQADWFIFLCAIGLGMATLSMVIHYILISGEC